jgi:hypothetical protein
MANAIYPLYKGSLLNADTNVSLSVNTTTDGPYCSLVDTGTCLVFKALTNVLHRLLSPVVHLTATI